MHRQASFQEPRWSFRRLSPQRVDNVGKGNSAEDSSTLILDCAVTGLTGTRSPTDPFFPVMQCTVDSSHVRAVIHSPFCFQAALSAVFVKLREKLCYFIYGIHVCVCVQHIHTPDSRLHCQKVREYSIDYRGPCNRQRISNVAHFSTM